MSIHAHLSEAAQARLHAQKRNSTISSVLISALAVILILLVLGVFLLPGIPASTGLTARYEPGKIDEPPENPTPINPNPRKPTPPASSPISPKVLAISSFSTISIPMTDVDVAFPSDDFGGREDFGGAWEEGEDPDGGGGSMFGSPRPISGALKGRLHDFKQNRRGNPISYDPSPASFADIVKSAERRDFSESAFSDYFVAPNGLHLTNLAIPYSPASLAPEYFGAKETIKPSGWVAVYAGIITAPASGKYRFRGASDDYMVVLVEGRRNLVACWPDLQELVAGRWHPGKMEGGVKSPLGSARLHAGEWMDLRAGKPVEIIVALGERPGGNVGFILEVEEEGRDYRTDPEGRKILPLFTTRPFTAEERREIGKRFGSYLFEWEDVPVFGAR